ncbi:ROK family protein [Companilactobacillus sp.]|jgi:predicted NBD/HSP70 family sugar kinase|uniref:ROK family protein n=1 Tax=Companilactobacillus sp. TaxID=2767905 RepID=UPI0025B9D002|nr:ROK family protein [Companilactobacillus sp.]MCH4009230.1 ROK family protein [Companilactobacillus sp.]MCH4050591.1 ROK family protein [Companilactobacillus sp.]MCH4077172.1 ROK family protein [Companilactobacillus sp.]MCH4125748.1 ROK family protein [Companilactobacillus sp.]MCI1311457.1 ROK family protein [Companilactobacillus sp.]
MIINKDVMRNNNERSVLQSIVNGGPISRNKISKQLGLNKVTVSDIVGSFLDSKLIFSLGEAKSSTTSGRKPELVEYNSNYGYIVNFSISGRELNMLVTKMDGRTLEYNSKNIEKQSIKEIIAKMEDLLDQLPDFDSDNGLQAISLSIYGIVYNGEIIVSPFTDFEDFDLVSHFQDKYQVPVVMENEANSSAIFEQDFSKQEMQNIVTVSIHDGIGAGIIINTHLYRGNYGQAGEIGRIIIQDSGKTKRKLAKLPSFDSEWSQTKILDKAAKLKKDTNYSLEKLVEDYNSHDSEIEELIEDFCYHLAIITSDLIAAYDPQMIFFNSPLVDQLPEILKILQMKLGFLPLVPPLVLSKDVKYGTLLGGASLAIHRVLQMEGTRLIFHH